MIHASLKTRRRVDDACAVHEFDLDASVYVVTLYQLHNLLDIHL